jgi:HlyD family secretion protein
VSIRSIIGQLVSVIVRLAVLVSVFAAAVTGGYLGYHQYIKQKPASASTTYRFSPVVRGDLSATVSTTGSLVPINQVKLSFKTGGKLKELNAKVGDSVKAGTVLARIDTQDLEFTLAQNMISLENARLKLEQLKAGPANNDITIAKVNLDKATLTLQKAQGEYDKIAWRNDVGMSSQAQTLQTATLDYQTALANYAKATQGSSATDLQIQDNAVKSAQIQVDQARSNLQGAIIVAPFDGVISSLSGNVGEQVGSTPIITLIDLSAMRIEANLDETDIAKVDVGQTVNVTLDSLPDLRIAGKVTAIAPSANMQSGVVTYQVHVVPDRIDPRLRAGQTSTASIVVEHRTNVLYVANRAIKNLRGVKTVQIATADGQIVEKPVQTGLSNDANTEIISGLADGDMVAIATTATNQVVPTSSLFGGTGAGAAGGGSGQMFIQGTPGR